MNTVFTVGLDGLKPPPENQCTHCLESPPTLLLTLEMPTRLEIELSPVSSVIPNWFSPLIHLKNKEEITGT